LIERASKASLPCAIWCTAKTIGTNRTMPVSNVNNSDATPANGRQDGNREPDVDRPDRDGDHCRPSQCHQEIACDPGRQQHDQDCNRNARQVRARESKGNAAFSRPKPPATIV
jgi:hypothetical protein